VLRKLGRQPWTWLTTTGWIILITGGALFIGHVFKSGKLHYGSVRVIDQAGGSLVGETSLTGIYAPRTTSYHLDAVPADLPAPDAGPSAPTSPEAVRLPPPGWWSVVSTEQYGSHGGVASDVVFHQTDQGNAPEEMLINVWNLRFLREESTRSDRPMIDAALTYGPASPDGRPRLKGVIRNLTGTALTNVHVRVKAGQSPEIDRIEPNGAVNVDTSMVLADNEVHSGPGVNSAVSAANLWRVAGDLSATRSRGVELRLGTEQFACIYAYCAAPQPPAVLREAADGLAEQQHYEVVRAVVPLTAASESK
jgi:hypothetical protein